MPATDHGPKLGTRSDSNPVPPDHVSRARERVSRPGHTAPGVLGLPRLPDEVTGVVAVTEARMPADTASGYTPKPR